LAEGKILEIWRKSPGYPIELEFGVWRHMSLEGLWWRLHPTKNDLPTSEAADIVDRLKAACVGHPNASIPWPHRLLHDAIAEIEQLRAVYVARPADDWHEDIGDVLWWIDPVEEAPYVGSPGHLGHTVELRTHSGVVARGQVGGWPDYHQYFTPLPDYARIVAALERAKEAERAAQPAEDAREATPPPRETSLKERVANQVPQHVRALVALLGDALDQVAGVAIRAQEATEGDQITMRFDAVRRAVHRFQSHDPAMAALRAELHRWRE